MTVAETARTQLKQQITELLGPELGLVKEVLAEQFSSRSSFVQDVAGHVSKFQGKQFRPVLVLLAARLCGLPPRNRLEGVPTCGGRRDDPRRNARPRRRH
ncbi:MAG UNVERIFIED_CONTAM: hypothetical protein LVR18_00155 [Planctomycetaceae bacterium]